MKHTIFNSFCLPACLSRSLYLSLSLCLIIFVFISVRLSFALFPSPLFLYLFLSLSLSRSIIVGMIILVKKNELNTIISSPFYNIALSLTSPPPLLSLSCSLNPSLFLSFSIFSFLRFSFRSILAMLFV